MGTNYNMIARQLQMLASALPTMAEEDLLPAVLDACDGLLAEIQRRSPPIDQMDDVERAQLMGGYGNIFDRVESFAQKAEDALGVEKTRRALTAGILKMEDLQRKQIELDEKLNEVRQKTAYLDGEIKSLQPRVETAQQEYHNLQAVHNGLLLMQEEFSPEKIEAQRKSNSELLQQVTKQNLELNSLQAEEKKQQAGLDQIRRDITDTKNRIEAIPEEHFRLLQEYEQKQAYLERLQRAQQDCSPEKQQALAEKIAKLQPVTENLEAEMGQLQNHYDRLSRAKTELDQQNQILETNLLELLEESMGELNLVMADHRRELFAVKQQADEYQQSLDECRDIRRGYSDWFGADRVQLNAMLAALDRRENLQLSGSLNVRCQNKVRKLFGQVESNLEELDRILKACAVASRKDQADIERKAGSK